MTEQGSRFAARSEGSGVFNSEFRVVSYRRRMTKDE